MLLYLWINSHMLINMHAFTLKDLFGNWIHELFGGGIKHESRRSLRRWSLCLWPPDRYSSATFRPTSNIKLTKMPTFVQPTGSIDEQLPD